VLDRFFDLGPADDPRKVRVDSGKQGVDVPVVSTPGARVRVVRSGRDGELLRFVVWAHRAGHPMEFTPGERDEIYIGGTLVSPDEGRRMLGGG
jgi:hypothetical protein